MSKTRTVYNRRRLVVPLKEPEVDVVPEQPVDIPAEAVFVDGGPVAEVDVVLLDPDTIIEVETDVPGNNGLFS